MHNTWPCVLGLHFKLLSILRQCLWASYNPQSFCFPEAGLLVKSLKRHETKVPGEVPRPGSLRISYAKIRWSITRIFFVPWFIFSCTLWPFKAELGSPSPTAPAPSGPSTVSGVGETHRKSWGVACPLCDLFRNAVSPSQRELLWVVVLNISV